MARINLDERELKDIKAALTAAHARGHRGGIWPILAIDPGKTSMGWAYVDADGVLSSGQGPFDDVADTVDTLLDMAGPPFLFACEEPYTVTLRTLKAGNGGIGAISALQRASGYVEGALRRHTRRSVRWRPKPTSWRAVLGLNRRSTDESTARDETAVAVLLWVRAQTKRTLATERGADCVDEAMAIAMAYAALALLRSLWAGMQPPQPKRPTGRQPDLALKEKP